MVPLLLFNSSSPSSNHSFHLYFTSYILDLIDTLQPLPFFLMACLDSNMYNNTNTNSQAQPPMSPRISFSNDFVDASLLHQYSSSRSSSSEVPPASDFEFSVSNHNMMSADELFFKGRILPFSFKDTNNKNKKKKTAQMNGRTLRDELLANHDDNATVDFSGKPPKPSSSSSSNGWKGFLGLRKSHIGSRKPEKTDFEFSPQDPNTKSASHGAGSNEGSSSTDMEMGV